MSSVAAPARALVDAPTFYPSTDDMGEPTLHVSISILLRALIERWLASRGTPMFVGMNTFFYWKQFTPTETVAPDVYVLSGVSLSERPPSWKVWETGTVPSFAFEAVSSDVEKDYFVSPGWGPRATCSFRPKRRSSSASAPSARRPRPSATGSAPSPRRSRPSATGNGPSASASRPSSAGSGPSLRAASAARDAASIIPF
jgi:hypothetical protein